MTPTDDLTHRLEGLIGRRLSPLTLPWEDAANWCWKSEGAAPELIKLARTTSTDPFWHGIDQVFGFDRWLYAEQLPGLAGFLPPLLPLMPLPLSWLGRLQQAPVWSLPWREATVPDWSTTLAALLGDHIGRLHREPVPGLGHPLSGAWPLSHWPRQVAHYLRQHPQRSQFGKLAACPAPLPECAVWCLPDLRADQFLCGATGWCWSDWEALVWAPIEFDWALIELLLETPAQRRTFCEAYRRHRTVPDITSHRLHCRVLLWCFNAFGPIEWPELRERACWLSAGDCLVHP